MLIKELLSIKENRGLGMFNMDNVKAVEKMTDINKAKQFVIDIAKNSGAKKENIEKAVKMVNKARYVKDLMFGMTNFMLSHEDPNNKVISK